MRRRSLRSLVAVILLTGLFNATTSFACGPFSLDAIFVYTVHPGYPLKRFAGGEVGVVQPTYARSYLYVAYRHLEGSGLSKHEQEIVTALWKERLNHSEDLGDQDWIKAWLVARQKVSGLPESPKIYVYRNREKPNEYETYLNCQKDAFDTAIATLNQRIEKYGVDGAAVRQWIEGQDQVFANCSEGQHLPTPAVASTDILAQADRAYQIAAAKFYSSNFDEAIKGFKAVAADNTSPWQGSAPYLIARTFVRKASLGAAETRNDALSQAENQLNKIIADKRSDTSHAAAARLLNLVRLRLHPAERLRELAHILMVKGEIADLKQNLWDYTALLDGFLDTDNPEDKTKALDELRRDDLTDWIATLQSETSEALEHSLARWRTTHSTPWLLASLTKADGANLESAALVTEAMNVSPTSPAFPSARFHAARLMMESGKSNEARALLDQLLKDNRDQFDESSLNLLIRQRMLLASSLADFLTYAARVPASFSWNDDGREIPSDDSEVSAEINELNGKPLFDEATAIIINRQLPLRILKDIPKSNAFPLHLRRDIAQAVWLRAVLLGDNRTAEEMVPSLKTLVPTLSSLLDQFVSTSQPDAKRFSAIYAWLKFPGLEPVVEIGLGRSPALNEQDTYRNNWWCSAAFPDESEGHSENGAAQSVKKRTPSALFLSEAQQAEGAKEWSTLNAFGAAPNYLCRQAVQWATKNPTDPRAPEALHLAVNSTRHGCTDKETGRWSKAAFDLLHSKFPGTTWAKKTPYWFKD
jgi:hypothetical protein